MKWLELIGVILAGVGFGLLSTGYLKNGFIVGLFSCLFLLVFFCKNNEAITLSLQFIKKLISILINKKLLCNKSIIL